jgi:hypothetical protein
MVESDSIRTEPPSATRGGGVARPREIDRAGRPTGGADDRLRLVRLTRKWVLSGAFGRKTSKRAARALDAAEQLDAAALSARWEGVRRRRGKGTTVRR